MQINNKSIPGILNSNGNENRKIKIGLVLDFIVSEYSEFIMDGVKECGRKMNLDILIFPAGEINNQSKNFEYQYLSILSHIKKENLDGVIFVSSTQTHYITLEQYAEFINKFDIPIVNIGNEIPGIPSIVVDYEEAYKQLVEHVIRDIGAKKIAVMSVESQSYDVILREKILKKIFEDYFIPEENVTWWKSHFSYTSAMYVLSDNALKHPKETYDYDAVFALNDDMALACADFFRSKGKSIPEDMVITGIDDMRKASFNIPALSTINQRVYEQGYVAARTLLDKIKGHNVPMLQKIQGKAVLRQSTKASEYINKIKNNEYIEIDRAALAGSRIDNSAAEWYRNRTQLYRVEKCYLDIQMELRGTELAHHLEYNIKALGIPYIAVVAYDKPVVKDTVFDYFEIPATAEVIFAYDTDNPEFREKLDANRKFNPREKILPEALLEFNSYPMICYSLYNGNKQFGYMLTRKTDFDVAVYEILAKIMSIQCTKLK